MTSAIGRTVNLLIFQPIIISLGTDDRAWKSASSYGKERMNAQTARCSRSREGKSKWKSEWGRGEVFIINRKYTEFWFILNVYSFCCVCVCSFVRGSLSFFLSVRHPCSWPPFSFCDISNFSRCISMRRRMLVNYHQITKHLFSNGKINNRTNELGDKMEKQFDRKTINKKATTTTTTSDKRPKKTICTTKLLFSSRTVRTNQSTLNNIIKMK